MNYSMDSYGFFDWREGDADTYEYTAGEFSQFISAMMGNGVAYGWGQRFNETHSGLTITVGSGLYCIDGRWGFSTGDKTFDVTPSGTTYIFCNVDTVNRTFEIASGAELPAGAQLLYTVTATTAITSVVDGRSYAYTGGAIDSARVIYSATQPTPQSGVIWLKPAN